MKMKKNKMKKFYFIFGIRMETRPVRRARSPRVETAEIWPPKSVTKISDKNANDSEGMKSPTSIFTLRRECIHVQRDELQRKQAISLRRECIHAQRDKFHRKQSI